MTSTSTFGKDTPIDRPNPGGRAAVFVPSATADDNVMEKLRAGTGMVGFGNKDGSVMVYFEGNRFNDSSLHKWEDKIFKAYDRMVKLAPTVNKLSCGAEHLEQVGFIEGTGITIRKRDTLLQWLKFSNALDMAPEEVEFIPHYSNR